MTTKHYVPGYSEEHGQAIYAAQLVDAESGMVHIQCVGIVQTEPDRIKASPEEVRKDMLSNIDTMNSQVRQSLAKVEEVMQAEAASHEAYMAVLRRHKAAMEQMFLDEDSINNLKVIE